MPTTISGTTGVSQIQDGIVATADIADDAVTADKLANSINTAIAANTAKTGITSGQASAITANTAKATNVTHTGDVTGSGALTIATDAVDIAMLSATGTASSSTFLRGDGTWAAAGGGKVLQVIYATTNTTVTKTLSGNAGSGDYVDTGLTATITPTESDSDILVMFTQNVYTERTGSQYAYGNDYDIKLFRDSTELINTGSTNGYGNFMLLADGLTDNPILTSILTHNYFDTARSSGTSAIAYKTQGTPYRAGLVKFQNQGFSTMTLMEIGV